MKNEDFCDKIYYIELLKTPLKNERNKEGEHYIKYHIDLEKLIKSDKRKKKLERITR